jgi:hypothetical protein
MKSRAQTICLPLIVLLWLLPSLARAGQTPTATPVFTPTPAPTGTPGKTPVPTPTATQATPKPSPVPTTFSNATPKPIGVPTTTALVVGKPGTQTTINSFTAKASSTGQVIILEGDAGTNCQNPIILEIAGSGSSSFEFETSLVTADIGEDVCFQNSLPITETDNETQQ